MQNMFIVDVTIKNVNNQAFGYLQATNEIEHINMWLCIFQRRYISSTTALWGGPACTASKKTFERVGIKYT